MALSRRALLTYGGCLSLLPHVAQSKQTNQLQQQIDWLIKKRRSQGRISRSERTAWSVYDFKNHEKLVSINEERPMQAASMVKLFVALAYFYLNKQAPHRYPYGSKQRIMMEKMLVRSNNSATNTIMKWCKGPSNVARLCQKATNGKFRQLRIVEYIPAGGRTYRNRASARDYSKFLYALWNNKLPHSAELKRIISIQNRDRIKSGSMPGKVTVFDKTGSTGMLCGDAGIIRMKHTFEAYTFIGIIERSRRTKNYKHWIRSRGDVMRDASAIAYKYMLSR